MLIKLQIELIVTARLRFFKCIGLVGVSLRGVDSRQSRSVKTVTHHSVAAVFQEARSILVRPNILDQSKSTLSQIAWSLLRIKAEGPRLADAFQIPQETLCAIERLRLFQNSPVNICKCNQTARSRGAEPSECLVHRGFG